MKFWLHLDWLWAEELPDPLEAVTQILKVTLPQINVQQFHGRN